jgi:signal transduction histidine kinase
MSLKLKFASLLAITGISVAMMLGVSMWSFNVIDREVFGALNGSQRVLDVLYQIKRAAWEQAVILGNSPFPADDPPEILKAVLGDDPPDVAFSKRAVTVAAMLGPLPRMESQYTKPGISRTRAVIEGAATVDRLAAQWFEHDDDVARRAAVLELYRQHERIENMEIAAITDSGLAVSRLGPRLRSLLTIALVSCAFVVLLAGALGVLLVRRWVLSPVADLREAAARIGAGDYDHRVKLKGNDEISQLGHEVDEMSGLIHRMIEERIENERLAAVGEMVQRIVHNIRGPLGGIRSVAEVAERSADSQDLVRASLARIRATVDRFDIWVNEMLQVTRPVDIQPRPVELAPWLASVVESGTPAAEAAGVLLDLALDHPPERPSFDPAHLEQALVAIITNAIQATPSGGHVHVRAGRTNPRAPWRIEIDDSGPGIDPDNLARIFRPYFTTKKGGNGIGLAHARQIVERHEGRLWAENIENGDHKATGHSGARFVIELPDKPLTPGANNR